jgi:hypothetical protein
MMLQKYLGTSRRYHCGIYLRRDDKRGSTEDMRKPVSRMQAAASNQEEVSKQGREERTTQERDNATTELYLAERCRSPGPA